MLDSGNGGNSPANGHLSYKFQRLREQLRSAVVGGDFCGRLPGERELGKRFGANAKTINKALCDLASEGLVVRHIGRGTFVVPRNAAVETSAVAHRYRAFVSSGVEGTACNAEFLEQLGAALAGEGHSFERGTLPNLTLRQTLMGTWPISMRRETSGVFIIPHDPLTSEAGRLDEASMSELMRRQMPVVMTGALSGGVKLNAVAPDYCDGGFRLCEHLAQAGCDEIVIILTAQTREAQMVASGAAAAAKRYGVECNCAIGELPSNGHHQMRGVICAGIEVLNRMVQDPAIRRKSMAGEIMLAAMLAPGDESAKRAGVAWYDVSVKSLAQWTARLMMDSKPGNRPMEVIIPGVVRTVQIKTGSNGSGHIGADRLAVELAEAGV